MRKFEPGLMRLLIIKGACRTGPPVFILWSILEWWRLDWRWGLGFAALTINYVIVYLLTWTAPALMNGPWRVRPWQTLILLANVFVLPIVYRRAHGHLPYVFFVAALFCFASLYVGTAIYLHLHEKLPKGVFAGQAQVSPGQARPETQA